MNHGKSPRTAVFLDRDGTVNREAAGGFVRRPEDLELFPGAREALTRLKKAGFLTAILTNQSGVARGLYTEEDLARVHERLRLELPGLIDHIGWCPHLPEGVVERYRLVCGCRKPAPGLLLEAAERLGAAMEGSFVVGDGARDLLAARDLPLETVLVTTGKDPGATLAELAAAGHPPHHVAEDLPAAASWILGRRQGR